jgi:hypothetical protein
MCLQSSDNTNILVVLSLEVTSIIWQKMQMWLTSKSQNLLHKRLLAQEIHDVQVCA